jgi:predicted flap endonuclease-1-like 5' DNA nuclease
MVELQDLDGVGDSREEYLHEEGYESVEDVASADHEVLGETVSYLPEDTALELVVQAQNAVEQEDAAVEESQPVTEEVADAVEGVEDTDSTSASEVSQSDSERFHDDDDPSVGQDEETSSEVAHNDSGDVSDESENDSEISFTLTFDEPLEYDTFFDAVMRQREKMLRSNRDGVSTFTHALDQMRGSEGVGATVELSMDEPELNNLHNCVRQTMVGYKGDNLIDHMDALKTVLSDINDVRSEQLF